MKESAEAPPERDLYALLHLSPEASDEEIRRAYRQWAQIYHPDKYQDLQMKDIATENFQRIRDAYGILSDEYKRQIYDIYGMEGLNSGLELGPKLNRPEEIKEELERLRRRKEEEKAFAYSRPAGSIFAHLSVPQYLDGGGILRGMAMSSEVQSHLSKNNTIAIGGNLAVTGNSGTGGATALLRHQLSSVSSIEFMATAGLRAVVGLQTTRHLSRHSTATTGFTVSLKDGSVNLSNAWTRQLSETSVGNFGTSSIGASAHYTRHFSKKSHGRLAGRIGSTAMELEIGGGRRISEFSTVRILYSIGIQGISWKFELHRAGQKLIIPIMLFTELNARIAAGAFLIPSSLYFLIKNFVAKPYYLRRERTKELERMEKSSVQVREARQAAEKAQKLLQNVSNRKRNKQLENGGLVITRAVYGNRKAIKRVGEDRETEDEMASQVLDVTLPLNFLVSDSGQLKLHEGIKKSGIMGFCDPCPGEPKQLLVEYTFGGQNFKVVVDDYEELLIPPQEAHRI
ncbi:uncharacterized protein A4U43_C10F310 [Asparagus officinalis]|uniref:J domain-containing protein n=1 Tax=Asparagus officinalis TaxID=4686 RepID=A0A5P1DZG8_ASPOF|nr:uncharacterized protein A4U43_C10F310 [Asparagus officinalis]